MSPSDRASLAFSTATSSLLLLPLLALGASCSAPAPDPSAGSVASGGAAASTAGTGVAGANGPSGGRGGTASQTAGAGGSVGGGASTGGASAATGGVGGAQGGSGANAGGNGGGDAVGGSSASGGGMSSGGRSAMGGAGAVGGLPSAGTGGTGTSGGAGKSAGGASGSAGQGAAGSGPIGGGTCGTVNLHPFGCKFAWGIADPGGSSYANYGYVDFMSYWVDSSISASGTYTSCGGCNWLGKIKSTNLIPVYVAYLIGYLGHANGVVDGNQSGSKKLTTDGAQLIRDHRQQIVDAYGWYATKTHAAWPDKPLVWMLEGDFVQYTLTGQKNALSYAELAALAADITCAIKTNMPNAVVAIDQSSWNADDVTNDFWGAMKTANVSYDMVWTTGVGNNKGYLESGTNDTSYNHTTAKYSYLHTLTGRTIMVDTSAGASSAGDSWSTASAADLNARAAEGVIAADITGTAPGNLQSNLTALRPALSDLGSCP